VALSRAVLSLPAQEGLNAQDVVTEEAVWTKVFERTCALADLLFCSFWSVTIAPPLLHSHR